jgi:hypothetical protein
MAFLVKVSGHRLESSQTRVFVRFSTLIFAFYKMLFMNRLKFSYFSDFFQTREEYGNLENSLVEGTVNSMEQRTRVFCKIDVQEFHLGNESRRSEDSREKIEVRQRRS